MIETQKPGFTDLYNAFYNFFLESIRQDSSICNKIRLQVLTQYFDELPLYKVINPIIIRINSNAEDRRAISRAALWDALFAHNNGKMFEFYQTHDLKENEPVKILNAPMNETRAEATIDAEFIPTPPEAVAAKRGPGRPARPK